jgi:hypothetical protein
MNRKIFIWPGTTCAIMLILMFSLSYAKEINNPDGIMPYLKNPHFWQYKGEPVLLLGATNHDNLFQAADMIEQLDALVSAGGNYIRCSMRSRDKDDIFPFLLLDNGLYDLNQWNPDYWSRFQTLLREAYQRDVIVQIEFWDLHDLHGSRWDNSPWNPEKNINYTIREIFLQKTYPADAMLTRHDFFFTVPALSYDVTALSYQQKFFNEIIRHTFEYPNILYCISNEIFPTTSPEWGWYWANYLKEQADLAGKTVYVTEMFWDPEMRGLQHRASLERPDIYDFFEASQNSSSVHGRHNWEKSLWLLEYMRQNKTRPINHVKIYGNDLPPDGIEDHDALARFWRNILAGAASSRFHRPASGFGLGLIPRTMAHIKSARLLLSSYDIFRSMPDYNHRLLTERENNEAYLSYIENEAYVVYFPYGGEVGLDMKNIPGSFELKWLQIDEMRWSKPIIIEREEVVSLRSPVNSHALVLLRKIDK